MGFWAPLIAGIASSALSAATTKKGTPGGYDYITPKSVGESSPTGIYGSDYWQRAMSGLATGEPWRGYGDYEALMKRKLQRGQKEAFYGTPGSRTGAYQTAMETGAITGLGAGQTQRSMRPLQNQWITGSQAIEEFLAQQGAQAMQQREQTLLGYGSQLSQPYQGQVVPYAGTPAQESPWAKLAGSAMGAIDWGSLGSKAGGSGGFWNAMDKAPYSYMQGSPTSLSDIAQSKMESILPSWQSQLSNNSSFPHLTGQYNWPKS